MSHTWKIARILEFSYKKELNAIIDGYDCNVSNLSIFSETSSEDSFMFSQPEPDWRGSGERGGAEKKEEAKREESGFREENNM